MYIKLELIEVSEVYNVIPAYVSYTGCGIEQKQEFYEKYEQLILKCKYGRKGLLISGDVSRHFVQSIDGFSQT